MLSPGEIQAVAGALTALGGLLVAFGVPKYFQYRSERENKALVREAFESNVKSLASSVEVERIAAGILLRRFFDVESEVGIPNAPFAKEVIGVITAILRSQETGTFQKILVDTLKYAPNLQRTDLQNTNLQDGYLGSDRIDLSHSDLYRANLSGGSLKGAKVRAASFYQAHLQGTVLDKADLRDANFFEANAQGASFDGANLEGATFDYAFLRGASFRGAINISASLAARLDENQIFNDFGPLAPMPVGAERRPTVFLSKAGLPGSLQGLLYTLQSKLENEGFDVSVLDRKEYSPGFGSLAEIKRRIARCAGAVVLGSRDITIKDGVWREGTSEEASLEGHVFSTTWVHLEAGMAVMAGLPLLIVSEAKIRGGMFDLTGREHGLYRADADDFDNSSGFGDWCRAVRDAARRSSQTSPQLPA